LGSRGKGVSEGQGQKRTGDEKRVRSHSGRPNRRVSKSAPPDRINPV
jgi:hypothetical protein